MSIATRRKSKYVELVREALSQRGHATNAELLTELHQTHPSLSPTTVHRITQRLFADGECISAPSPKSGEICYDANLLPHDHFFCSCCQELRDISLPASVYRSIESELHGCTLDGQLLIIGNCHNCKPNDTLKEGK